MESIASRARINPPRDASPNALRDKVALVTGSSSGIGAAVARELAARGASVVLNYPTADLAETTRTVGESLADGAVPWIAVQADLSTTDGPAALVRAAVDRFGRLDIVVNNAGLARLATFEDTTADLWDRQMATNVRGAFLVTQAAAPHLPPFRKEGEDGSSASASSASSTGRGSGGGRIINITSAVETQPEVHQIAYATSKGALATLTRAMAKELPPQYGCTVNAVSPGIVKTGQFLSELHKDGGAFITHIFDARTPVDGWIGLPEDVAFAVAFLADERASWINGASINVSGGMFLS